MQIIRRNNFITVPWNNGGGITHEVARADADGKLLWRLSLAEVGRDGPFSIFAGLARVLTVIEGAGMDLVAPDGALAHPLPMLTPVHFSGDEELVGRLRNGPCLDFNLIYDPQCFAASAEVISGERSIQRRSGVVIDGLLSLEESGRCGEHVLGRHDFAFLQDGDPPLQAGPDFHALRLCLVPRLMLRGFASQSASA